MPSDEKIGLAAFSTMKAESEPWLVNHAFVPPLDFEFLKGAGSTIVYGDTGSGKSAVSYALEHYAGLQPNRFVVRWTPALKNKVISGEVSTSLAMEQLVEILSLCAHTLFDKLTKEPNLLKRAAPTAQEFLIWFIRQFNLTQLEGTGLRKSTKSSKKGNDFLRNFKTRSVRNYFTEEIDPIIVMVELTKALEKIGYVGVWIMIDGLQWAGLEQRKIIISSLRAILSTLKLFEIPTFCYKMTLPMEFETELADAIGVTRDRIMPFRLSWGLNSLTAIVEKRLSLVLDDNDITIDNIYNAKEICAWLEGCGGRSPRGWVEYFRPIVSTYKEVLSQGKPRKLTKSEWAEARKRSSLHLKFDPETNQVRIGMGDTKTVSSEIAAILLYLINNQGRPCTKRELYNKAYVPFITPHEKLQELGEQQVFPKEYDDLINTAIYRLRQIVEPIPGDPVFITTKRDIGIRLTTQAFQ